MAYIEQADATGCFFCAAFAAPEDELRGLLVLARDAGSLTIINKFPYGNGHLLVAPRAHVATLEDLGDDAYAGLMRAVRRASSVLREAFSPEGMNVGMNLGRA